MQMAAESSYKCRDQVMLATAILNATAVLVVVYEEEHRLTLNAYRRRVLVACTILNISNFSSPVVVVFLEEHNDLFISFSLS